MRIYCYKQSDLGWPKKFTKNLVAQVINLKIFYSKWTMTYNLIVNQLIMRYKDVKTTYSHKQLTIVIIIIKLRLVKNELNN